MGWGAGLTALANGLGNFDEVLRQRKLDELKKAESLRQEEELRLAKQRQAEELTNRQREMAMREQENQRQQQMQAKTLLEDSYSPSDALSPDAVAYAQKNMVPGYLRTEGATLPSSRWQGDPSTLSQDPGTPESTYRRPTMAERRLEDQQRQAKEIQAEALSERERQARAANLARSADTQERLRSAEQIARDRNETNGVLRALTGNIAQQNANTNAGQLKLAQDKAQETAAAAALDKKNKQASAAGGAQDINQWIDELTKDPGFSKIYGLFDQYTPNISAASRSAQGRLDQIKSALAVEKIMEMKAQSRTGATGFGQLSEKELNILQDAAGRLKQALTESDARLALADIKQKMNEVIKRNGGTPTEGTGATKKSAEELLKLYGR